MSIIILKRVACALLVLLAACDGGKGGPVDPEPKPKPAEWLSLEPLSGSAPVGKYVHGHGLRATLSRGDDGTLGVRLDCQATGVLQVNDSVGSCSNGAWFGIGGLDLAKTGVKLNAGAEPAPMQGTAATLSAAVKFTGGDFGTASFSMKKVGGSPAEIAGVPIEGSNAPAFRIAVPSGAEVWVPAFYPTVIVR